MANKRAQATRYPRAPDPQRWIMYDFGDGWEASEATAISCRAIQTRGSYRLRPPTGGPRPNRPWTSGVIDEKWLHRIGRDVWMTSVAEAGGDP